MDMERLKNVGLVMLTAALSALLLVEFIIVWVL